MTHAYLDFQLGNKDQRDEIVQALGLEVAAGQSPAVERYFINFGVQHEPSTSLEKIKRLLNPKKTTYWYLHYTGRRKKLDTSLKKKLGKDLSYNTRYFLTMR